MFFVEQPYVSDFLKRTLRDHAIPVVGTTAAGQLDLLPGTAIVSEELACRMIAEGECPNVYTTSENALGWFYRQEACRQISRKIEQFKNKFAFRTLTRPLFPDFSFVEVHAADLATFSFQTVSCPCVIKPSVGFFSMGVNKVNDESEWPATVARIFDEIERTQHLYPTEVFNPRTFIIEQCITGDEFAVDAYYTSTGDPVILGIFHHYFSSEQDVSDRVYTTSKVIIEQHLEEFTAFLGEIGRLVDARNLPMHIELRKSPDGRLLPIEVNPLRFGGWCTTPDLTCRAFGLNPYLAFYRQQRPDWAELLSGKDGTLFSVVVLDNSTGVAANEIADFQYEKVLSVFENPLELRKIDFCSYPVFGFLFTETREDHREELNTILHSTLREFVTILGKS